MSEKKERIELVTDEDDHRGHPLAVGLITGAAIGVGVGMLCAPRKGSELRHQVADTASKGYHRAKDTAGHYAHRGHDAYVVCKDKIAHGAQATGRYVREVSDAVTRKTHREAPGREQVTAGVRTAPSTSPYSQPESVRAREQASPKPEPKKDLKAV